MANIHFYLNSSSLRKDKIVPINRNLPGNNPERFVFVCFYSSQSSNRRTLFHYFSINIYRLFALHGILIVRTVCKPPLRRAVNNLELFDLNNCFLFYDCLNSCFTFYGNYNYTCRGSDCSVIGRDYCVSNCLTKYVADSNFLALSTLDDYCTVCCYY